MMMSTENRHTNRRKGMTAYNAIKQNIEKKAYATYADAWEAILTAYNTNKIDGMELEELAEMAHGI